MPENSIPGFIRAIDIGCHFLEMDVVLTSDKIPVVSHDPFLNPILFGDEFRKQDTSFLAMDHNTISEYTYGTIRNEEFPEQELQPVRIPTLRDTILNCMDYGKNSELDVGFNIEIKHCSEWTNILQYDHETVVDNVMKVVNEVGSSGKVIIQSFSLDVIRYLESSYPDTGKGMIIDRGEMVDVGELAQKFSISHIAPWFRDVTENLVKTAHQHDIKVIPWTVNDVDDMRAMMSYGVDGIITDHPSRLKALPDG